MKVAVNRGPGSAYILSDDNGYDWRVSIIVIFYEKDILICVFSRHQLLESAEDSPT